MSKLWQWFLTNGDKLLVGLLAYFASPAGQAMLGSLGPLGVKITAALALLHMFALPEPTPAATPTPTPAPTMGQKGNVNLHMLLALIVATLVACTALGLAAPKSLDEQLAAAQISETAVVSAASTAVTAGTLSSSAGQRVLDTAHQVDGFIAAAKTAEGAGNTASATNELQLATSALAALQTYVNQSGKK